jgi:hypothetical protein
VSIISTWHDRLTAERRSKPPELAEACWVCSAGSGPMCLTCSRRVVQTVQREARAGYVDDGSAHAPWSR